MAHSSVGWIGDAGANAECQDDRRYCTITIAESLKVTADRLVKGGYTGVDRVHAMLLWAVVPAVVHPHVAHHLK
jgi:hypothetical protein